MLKGKLYTQAVAGKVRVYFMQQGMPGEDPNAPVKIFRKQADDISFSFGMAGDAMGNWVEYIDNMKLTDPGVTCIFEGKLPYSYTFCEYLDEGAEIGHCYVYWVVSQGEDGTVLGPVGCRVRDPEVWWSHKRTVEELEKLTAEYPGLIEMKQYGETTMHRPMHALHIGNRDKVVALAGAVHASEPGPELLVRAVRHIIHMRPDLLEKVGLAMLPTINIDVREETVNGTPHYLRKNHNGVDLNRNFPWNWKEEFVYGVSNIIPESSTYHGPYAGSENESQAAMKFIDAVVPAALFVYDSASVITEDTLLFDGDPSDGPSYDYANVVANIYSQAFRANHPGCGTFTAAPVSFPPELDCFAETGKPTATFEGWAYYKYFCPSFSLQSSNSVEGRCNNDDQVPLERLEQWSLRHAYALIAVMEFLAEQKG